MFDYGDLFGHIQLLVLKAKWPFETSFYGKSDILNQLIFNVNVQCTLQNMCSRILKNESGKIISHINNVVYMAPRSTMTLISDHIYAIGRHRVTVTTAEQSAVLSFHGNIEIFYRLMKDGVLYYSTGYAKGEAIFSPNPMR